MIILLCSCFLSHNGAFWGTFLGPILAMMVFNVVIFVCVIVVLVRHTRDAAARRMEVVGCKATIRLLTSIGGVMCLFGLTWLFALLTFSTTGLRETFQILFTVFNSFQGFFIFLFITVNKETINSCKEHGKHKSALLYSGVTANSRRKESNTSSTGLTSPTSSKYLSNTLTNSTEERKFKFEMDVKEFPLKSKVDQGTLQP